MISSVVAAQLTATDSYHVAILVALTQPVLAAPKGVFQTSLRPHRDIGVVEMRLMQEATARKNVPTLRETTTGKVHAKMTKSAGVWITTTAILSMKALTQFVKTSKEPTM